MSDLCSSPFCGDIALPGHDLCAGCIADLQAEREQIAAEARRLTVEHQAQVEAVA